MNAHIESYHRILKDECLKRHDFRSFAHAYEVVSDFIKFYNNIRLHSSTKFLPPKEYFRKISSNSLIGKVVNV